MGETQYIIASNVKTYFSNAKVVSLNLIILKLKDPNLFCSNSI